MKDFIRVEGIQKMIFGKGALDEIGPACRALNSAKALLVMDRSLSQTPLSDRVRELLKRSRVRTALYPHVTPEPSPRHADQGADTARSERVSCVIGLGGGSTMDVAKAVAVLVKNNGRAEDYIGLNRVQKQGLPTIMVPTTAGTGSETTFTSVFTMREKKTKGGINSPFLYPHTAILDPELTLDLSPDVTAYTGMDALTHAIESYTSLGAHFMSEPISLEAVAVIYKNLRGAVFNGKHYVYREGMMQGSYLAGLGLAQSGVGAVHALAYPMGAFYDIPHGMANALMLPYVLAFNYPGNMEKFCRMAAAMACGEDGSCSRERAAGVSRTVYHLAEDMGIPLSLQDLDIPEKDIPKMAEAALKIERPIQNNPRPMTVKAAETIYRRAWEGALEAG